MNINKLHIITPVKDAIDIAFQTIEAILNSEISIDYKYTVYNDFSTAENTEKLQSLSNEKGFELVNLPELTSHPSPNYLLILQLAQKKALQEKAHLIIVESDVIVEKNTIQNLFTTTTFVEKPALVAAITRNESGEINFPYLYARKYEKGIVQTKKRLSFCCTLLSHSFLSAYNFEELNPDKSWYDVFISHKAKELGFNNYLITNLPVLHLPHSSRPWKQLKYSHPLKYYWIKYTKGKDKI